MTGTTSADALHSTDPPPNESPSTWPLGGQVSPMRKGDFDHPTLNLTGPAFG